MKRPFFRFTVIFFLFLFMIFPCNVLSSEENGLKNHFFQSIREDYYQLLKAKGFPSDKNPDYFILSVLSSRVYDKNGKSTSLFGLLNPDWKGLFDFCFVENPYGSNEDWVSKTIASYSHSDSVSKPDSLSKIDEMTLEKGKSLSSLDSSELDELVDNAFSNAGKPDDKNALKIKNDRDGLSFFSFGKEYVSYHENDENGVLLNADENHGVRRFYDQRMRLSKKEIWKIDSDKKWEKESSEEYEYNGDESVPLSSVITGKDFKKEISFYEDGKMKSSVLYEALKNDEKGEKSENSGKGDKSEKKSLPEEYLKKEEVSWIYNEDGKVTEKSSVTYEYRENSKRIAKKEERKETFEYKIKDCSPDYCYYENNILRLSTVYSSPDEYKTTSIFDSGFTVESYYENGLHVKDIYFVNGIVRRSRSYE